VTLAPSWAVPRSASHFFYHACPYPTACGNQQAPFVKWSGEGGCKACLQLQVVVIRQGGRNRPARSAQRGRPRGSLFPEHDLGQQDPSLCHPGAGARDKRWPSPPVPRDITRSTPNNPAPFTAHHPGAPACYRGSTTSPPLLLYDYLVSRQSFLQSSDLGRRTGVSSFPGRRWRAGRHLPSATPSSSRARRREVDAGNRNPGMGMGR